MSEPDLSGASRGAVRVGITFKVNVIVLAVVLTLGAGLGAAFVLDQERLLARELERRIQLLGATLSGTVAAALEEGDVDRLNRILARTALDPDIAYVLVRSVDGEVRAARWASDRRGSLSEYHFPLGATARPRGPGEEPFGAVVPPESGPEIGVVAVGVDLAPLRAARSRLVARTAAGVVAAAFVATLLGVLLVRALLRRSVLPLVAGIREFAAGDPPRPLAPRVADDEVGEIARAFDDLVARLASTLVTKGELEAVVAARTADLTAALAEQRRLEQQVVQSQKLESVGRLAGGVAHDFNNLLVGILGYTDFLEEGIRAGRPSLADLAEVRKAGTRARDLTSQLLAIGRRQVVEPRVVDVNEVLRDAEKLLRRVLGEDVDLATHYARDLWPVEIDPSQLHQVVLNLAVNARDAMPHGGNLTIETANTELDARYAADHPEVRPGPYAMLAVSDSGAGMPPEVVAHAFEPFFTTKAPSAGTGLGLATVYGIVKQARGHVSLYSEAGRGTTFRIYLPRTEAAPTAPAPPPPARQLRGTERILVVEDDPLVRGITCRSLTTAGYEVLSAPGPREAVALAASVPGPIDLLVTDVVMPNAAGKALADELRAARPGLRVLYVSGYTENTIVHHGVLDAGVHFLAKPFTPRALQEKVRGVLDG